MQTPSLLLALFVLLVTATARCQESSPRRAELEVRDPEGCLSRHALSLLVAARLGYDPFATPELAQPDEELERFRVDVEGRGGDREVRLVRLDPERGVLGARRWSAAPCDDATQRAVAFTLALLLREALAPQPPSPTPEVGETPALETTQPAPLPEPQAPRPPARSALPPASTSSLPLVWSLWISGGLALETAPSPVPSFAIGSSLTIAHHFSVGLEGRADLPIRTAVEGGELETSVMQFAISLCGHYQFVGACALGGLGALRSDGFEFSNPASATSLYANLGARVLGQFRFDPVSLGAQIDVLGSLARTSVSAGDVVVWRLPPVSVVIGVRVGVFF